MRASKYFNLVIRQKGTSTPHPALLPGNNHVNTLQILSWLYHHLKCNVKHNEGCGLEGKGVRFAGLEDDAPTRISILSWGGELRWNFISCCRHAVLFMNRSREPSLVPQGIAWLLATLETISKTGLRLRLANYLGGEITDANTMLCYFSPFPCSVTATQWEIMT